MILIRKLMIIFFVMFSPLGSTEFTIYDIPVQENGRIKPLDTYARNQLLSIYAKRSISADIELEGNLKSKISAVEWLIDITIHPEKADRYNIFKIRNPEVVGSLGLIWDTDHLYNRREVLLGLQDRLEYFGKIQSTPEDEWTEFDTQMMNIYSNVLRFQEISYSFTSLLNIISISDSTLANMLSCNVDKKISYYDVMKNANVLISASENISNKKIEHWTKTDTAISILLNQIHHINQDQFARHLKIIPSENNSVDDVWLSVWEIMDGRTLSSEQKEILSALSGYLNARLENNNILADKFLMRYENALIPYANILNINNIKREKWYNEINLFTKSIIFYILAFLVLAISWLNNNLLIRKISFISLLIGFLFHFYGIIVRILIMQRPPISTLYESVIFVSVIGVFSSILLEFKRKDGTGIFVGSICGTVLHFVGFGYASDGDTLGMLVAVLNSNFWLATHVTTITTGYGTSLFAGLLGHVYLIQYIRFPSEKKYLNGLYQNIYGVTLFALFFTMFGTILGGIWADQSWGRFWGWDPKENGALLIVLWQIMLLHMRIIGSVTSVGFAFGMILNNIIVVLAWFGVNLLSVGLHSYGFAEGIARNIFIFILIEFTLGVILFITAKKQ